MELIENIPFKFDEDTETCFVNDGRRYCQMVEQGDHFTFIIKGSKCYDCPNDDNYDTEAVCPFNPAGLPTGNWALTSGSTTYYTHTTGATTALSSVTNRPAGYWEVTVTIKKVPGTALAGSVLVAMAGVTSSPALSAEGTFKVYITSTSSGVLRFTPSSTFNGQIGGISFTLVETNYKLVAFDLDTGAYVDEWDIPSKARDYFYLTGLWSSLGLSNGCYYFKVLDGCINGQAENLLSPTWGSSQACTSGCSLNVLETTPPYNVRIESSVNDNTNNMTIYNNNQLIVGVCYTITYTAVVNPAKPEIRFVMKADGASLVSRTTSGTYTESFTALDTYLQFYIAGTHASTDGAVDIDTINIVVCDSGRVYSNQSACYDLQTIHPCTKLLKWTNSDSAFNLPYSYATLVHYLRVFAIKDRSRYPSEGDMFVDSAGEGDIIYAKSEKIWRLWLDYLPEYLHDAIALARIHDHFYIDDVEYRCLIGNYEPEWRGQNRIAQGSLEIQKKIDNNVNYNNT